MPDDDDARVPAVDDGCEDPVELRRRLEALQLENAVMRDHQCFKSRRPAPGSLRADEPGEGAGRRRGQR